MLADLQGLQECGPGAGAGKTRDTLSGDVILDDPCGSLEVKTKGSMSTEEYDKAVFDLVNFLAYMGEPIQDDRKRIGIYALLLLLLFSVFAYLLNREYWKGIH
jgi:ubiquinol-cytochrome c reductase cytochrome b subunit